MNMANTVNYITIIKELFPKIAITEFGNPSDYSAIKFVQNGEIIPSKEELDLLIQRKSAGSFVAGSGEIIRTFFLPVGIYAGTSVIPIGNSAPLITQGSLIQSLTVTPTLLASKFSFSSSFIADCASNNKSVVVAMFRDNTCFYSTSTELFAAGRPTNMSIEIFDAPNTLSPVTYSLRVGISSNATWYLNQLASGQSNGGTTTSVLKISEYS